ncbi:MAG: response regulator [Anaerolineales bacterium]|nr:response regulator [Anaerolineales bacterium]MCB0016388.1 response regulator [Anaerolineales bacterium]
MSAKILIIDDHPETSSIVATILQNQGFDTDNARSGSVGISLAEASPPDLIILDIMMPDMDGIEVCRRLRALPVTENIPIIMFTSLAEARDKRAGFDAGATDYLIKPTHPNELIRRVEEILNR